MSLKLFNPLIGTAYQKIKLWIFKETWALPVDIFRVLVGILSFVYFLSLTLQVNDFSNPDGLINHDFYLSVFWWLRINLIQPGLGISVFYLLTGFACLTSVGLIIGYRVRLIATINFIIAVSIQRWNFAVMYVDDAIMHLILFWMILLPVGKTIILSQWLKEGNKCFSGWTHAKIPGFAVRCLVGNICWIYFFAGMAKLTSEYWREGFALYAAFLLPISYMPNFWKPEHLPFLRLATYTSLIIEITLPFFLLSPKNSLRKWIGLPLLISFNLGILLTLKIPYANIALIAACVIIWREELMEAILRRYNEKDQLGQLRKLNWSSILATVFLILLVLSTLREVPFLRHNASRYATYVLWPIGVAQSYHLFDWIERLSYHIDTEVKFYPSGGEKVEKINTNLIIPNTVRHTLLIMRLYDIYWTTMFYGETNERLKEDIRKRFARRACKKINKNGRVKIQSAIHHVTPENIDLKRSPKKIEIAFYCKYGEVINF